MQPHELVLALIGRTGKSTLQIAKEMGSASFQGTLHKIAHGVVHSPSRQSAERIAKYFEIPVDALYDARMAQRIGLDRGLTGYPAPQSAAPLEARESTPEAYHPKPLQHLPPPLLRRLATLEPTDFNAVLSALEALVSSYESQYSARSKPARA